MKHHYDYFPCVNCGQVVAHTRSGIALHMHERSKKCELAGKKKRAAEKPRALR